MCQSLTTGACAAYLLLSSVLVLVEVSHYSSGNSSYKHTSKLVPISQDLISALDSQAFVERVFLLCGILAAAVCENL